MTQQEINEKADAYMSGGMKALKELKQEKETARKLAEAEARIAKLEKMRSDSIDLAKSVMEDDFFTYADWAGLLEILE